MDLLKNFEKVPHIQRVPCSEIKQKLKSSPDGNLLSFLTVDGEKVYLQCIKKYYKGITNTHCYNIQKEISVSAISKCSLCHLAMLQKLEDGVVELKEQ